MTVHHIRIKITLMASTHVCTCCVQTLFLGYGEHFQVFFFFNKDNSINIIISNVNASLNIYVYCVILRKCGQLVLGIECNILS